MSSASVCMPLFVAVTRQCVHAMLCRGIGSGSGMQCRDANNISGVRDADLRCERAVFNTACVTSTVSWCSCGPQRSVRVLPAAAEDQLLQRIIRDLLLWAACLFCMARCCCAAVHAPGFAVDKRRDGRGAV